MHTVPLLNSSSSWLLCSLLLDIVLLIFGNQTCWAIFCLLNSMLLSTSFLLKSRPVETHISLRHLRAATFCASSPAFSFPYISQWSGCFVFHIIGHYNPTVRIIDLVSHITYVVCVNFMHKWQDLQFKVDTERQIFWETFHGNFYWLSEFLPEICWEEIAEEILFVFRFDVWPGTRTLAFRLISQHTIY